jgi:hypothetical protein
LDKTLSGKFFEEAGQVTLRDIALIWISRQAPTALLSALRMAAIAAR